MPISPSSVSVCVLFILKAQAIPLSDDGLPFILKQTPVVRAYQRCTVVLPFIRMSGGLRPQPDDGGRVVRRGGIVCRKSTQTNRM